mgnify:FL=1
MPVGQGTLNHTIGYHTRRWIGPMAGKSRTGGIKIVPMIVLDPPQVRRVKTAPETGNQRLKRNVGTMARKVTRRASAGRSTLIQIYPDLARSDKGTDGSHTTPKDRKNLHPERPKTASLRDKVKSIKKNTSSLEKVWYVNSGASNHMMSHEECFWYLGNPKQLGVVETGVDTPHPIEHC